MNENPLVQPRDRFPLGLPGHVVPVSPQQPTPDARPWGMDQAVVPAPVRAMGKHDKPTSTRTEKVPTEYTDDSQTKKDDYTQTVTD
ncbi:hypothetical protein ACFOY4_30130 [Actinomadura syzygii]|uniref:Uncharacterized protein n=1 Tax=Actinomadura syzygii TaxID=1427538 RepID=A0A5D0TUA7_9ACTN|nr:hypothetical protein [Actinomadura syzygii]TYC09427.1 hypothetical protein FXF65_34825 [Actinomadura syzygii]